MNPAGTSGSPSLAKIEQNNMPAKGTPSAAKASIALSISARYRSHDSDSEAPARSGRYASGNGTRRKSGSNGPTVMRNTSALLPW